MWACYGQGPNRRRAATEDMLLVPLLVLLLLALLPATAAADGLPGGGHPRPPAGATRRERGLHHARRRPQHAADRARALRRAAARAQAAGLVLDPGGRLRRVAQRPRRGRPQADPDQPAEALPARADDVRGGGHPQARGAASRCAAGRLQLRRDLARRPHDVPDRVSARDLNNYAVRAYDLRTRRLLPRPVVDPHEADEPMRGIPVTRVPSTDGRWAYTLYDNGRHSFVHALDTARRTAGASTSTSGRRGARPSRCAAPVWTWWAGAPARSRASTHAPTP